ncbi:subtilisin-like protease SBT5.1 [Silene latifolia]|uniref:subtilisin-like protease SBT5.1 n=1 Tax=Silene latifolia TaxID=37657 RepID=UPI003D7768B3
MRCKTSYKRLASAMYSVSQFMHCSGSAILAAFDDTIKDGVDIPSLSFGNDNPIAFLQDPIVIGALHVVQKGITVSCAAGNFGPSPQSIFNYAPWIITVGATTIDRFFESKVILGNEKVIKGEGINFSLLKKSPIYELVDGSEHESRVCQSKSQHDQNRVKGKIVLCNFKFDNQYNIDQLQSVGAAGVIGIVHKLDPEALISSTLSVTIVLLEDGLRIADYIKSSWNPTGFILATRTILSHKPAAVIPNFSS